MPAVLYVLSLIYVDVKKELLLWEYNKNQI